jgi:hypothetical protein
MTSFDKLRYLGDMCDAMGVHTRPAVIHTPRSVPETTRDSPPCQQAQSWIFSESPCPICHDVRSRLSFVPVPRGRKLLIAPLLSWYHASWDAEPDLPQEVLEELSKGANILRDTEDTYGALKFPRKALHLLRKMVAIFLPLLDLVAHCTQYKASTRLIILLLAGRGTFLQRWADFRFCQWPGDVVQPNVRRITPSRLTQVHNAHLVPHLPRCRA